MTDDGSPGVSIGTCDRGIEDNSTVGIIGRSAGEDDGGITRDAVRIRQRGAAAAEAEGGLTIDDICKERPGEGEVLIRT